MALGKTQFVNGGANDRALGNRSYLWPQTSGDVFFVHSSGSGTTGPGYAPENAYTTINSALGAAAADHDDIVVVLPGHTETITGAAGIAMATAGVKLIGLGHGRRRPRITFSTSTAASFDITAARCVAENLVLINGIDAQTAMLNVQAADAVIENCEFQLGNATTQAALGILTNASADRMRVHECFLHGTVDAGVTSAIKIVGGDSVIIERNRIIGAFGTAGGIANATTATTGFLIWDNTILNMTADGNNTVIVMASGSTGLIANNRGGIIDSTSPAPVTAAGAWVSGNYWSTAVGVAASTLM